ncbi:hypothetical protein [Rhodococcus sp. BE178]|uniref:hypothetical protein n=1 Tax=Rhodococcus sp. BE178 TaxID=2817737 RepID=UPI003D234554
MTDQFFMTRAEMESLQSLLREVPDVVDDLAVQLTRQSACAVDGSGIASGSDEQPLPFNVAAADARDLLTATLGSWARHVCEHRARSYDGGGEAAAIAAWLDRYVTSLAMTPGCEEAEDEIRYAVRQCRRACDIPEDRAVLYIDPALIPKLEALELSAKDCASTATNAGIPMTKRRVDQLSESKKVKPVRVGDKRGEFIYRLGDVLDANGTPLRADLGREVRMVG